MANNDLIPDDDYYLSNGLATLLFGSKFYSEAEAIYARLPEHEVAALAHIVPLPTAIRWSGRFKTLEAFVSEHGRTPSFSAEVSEEENHLAKWVDKQKTRLNLGRMTDEQKALLDTTAPFWNIGGAKEDAWEKKLAEAVADTNGGSSSIKSWLQNQKENFKNGSLSSRRAERLEQMLPAWKTSSKDVKWEESLAMVAAYIEEHGVAPSIYYDMPNSAEYADWIYTQRWRKDNGSLPEDQEKMLDQKIPVWRSRAIWDAKWEAKLKDCVAFMDTYKRLPSGNAKGTLDEEGGRERTLGKWVESQREALRNEGLPRDREDKLDRLVPFWRMGQNAMTFMEKLNEFTSYIEQSGEWPTTLHPLGKWLTQQRSRLRDGTMHQYYVDALDQSIPEWSTRRRSRRDANGAFRAM